MSDKLFPADWEQPITARGVTRNPAQKCYNVRISVAGKQLHVGCAAGQDAAARLYDMALWKLCPKMAKPPEPNDREWFSMLTQNLIDTKAPRLNKLYERAPFLRAGDDLKSEDALRERAQSFSVDTRPGEMADYDKALDFLRRAVVEVADLEVKLANRMSRIKRLHKLSVAPKDFENAKLYGGEFQYRLDNLRKSMESQRAYYQKLVDNS